MTWQHDGPAGFTKKGKGFFLENILSEKDADMHE